MQWLVKKALETREELAAQQRNSALHEFDKHGTTPADQEFHSNLPGATSAVLTIQAEYCANRQLKAPSVDDADEETRVQCTLLEYVWNLSPSKNGLCEFTSALATDTDRGTGQARCQRRRRIMKSQRMVSPKKI